MPTAARKLCHICSRTAEPGGTLCAKHKGQPERERSRFRRANELKSFYDTALWRKRTVEFILGRDPLCQLKVVCDGRAASTDVDHIIRAEIYVAQHPEDPSAFYDPENLRGACRACHSRKTMLEQQGLWREPGARGEACRRGGGQNV